MTSGAVQPLDEWVRNLQHSNMIGAQEKRGIQPFHYCKLGFA